MPSLRLHFISITGTAVVFIFSLWANQEIFMHSELVRGVNWIYLPAGIRLLSTLLLGGEGVLGLLLASWLVDFRTTHCVLSSAALSRLSRPMRSTVSRKRFMDYARMNNLTAKRLFVLVLAYAIASALLHHIWFFLSGDTENIVRRFFAMFVGDLSGTLIVIYTVKLLLAFLPRPGIASSRDNSR